MRLALGPRSFDLTTRALVVGVVGDVAGDDLFERAEQFSSDGAGILELSGEALSARVSSLCARFDVTVSVSTTNAHDLAGALAAGAVMARPRAGDPGADYLAAAADAGTTIVISHGLGQGGDHDPHLAHCAELVAIARRCEDAGVMPAHIVLDCGMSPRRRNRVVALGYPVMASAVPAAVPAADDDDDDDDDDDEAVTMADLALALIDGCRLIRALNVRQARRVADTLAAVMEAR